MKKNKSGSDYVLTTWIAYMTAHIGLFIADYSEITYRYPHLLGVILPLPILHGFFLYWYTSRATGKHLSYKDVLLHLIPFFLLVTLAVPFYILPASEKLEVFNNKGKGFEWYQLIQITLFVVFGLGYSIASIARIRTYRRNLLNTFSNTERGRLIWLECIAYGFAAIWLVAYPIDDKFIFMGLSLFVLFIGAFGIRQTDLFTSVVEPVVNQKYQKSGLTDDDASKLSETLKTFMEINKPYKDPNLTLDDLAGLLNVNSNKLSQVINVQEGRTFYHYINGYRIKEFLAMALEPDSRKLTYAGLASECGFQSKTTFNKYFKMETGKTPSEYFQSIEAEVAVA